MHDTNICTLKGTLVNTKVNSALETNVWEVFGTLSSSFTTNMTLNCLGCTSSRVWCMCWPRVCQHHSKQLQACLSHTTLSYQTWTCCKSLEASTGWQGHPSPSDTNMMAQLSIRAVRVCLLGLKGILACKTFIHNGAEEVTQLHYK